MSTQAASSLRQVARQHLQTMQLLGVDFVPRAVRHDHGSAADELGSAFAPQAISINANAAQSRDRRDECDKALQRLKAGHDAKCPHCTTATYHTQTVFGEGNPCADLMFVGEAPGEEEDRTGRPFVGRAGQKLDEIIKAMRLTRDDVYIANILKSRPPENRAPLPNEIDACGPYLAEQIRIIRPKVLVALGGPAAKKLLGTDIGITRIRGQWGWYEDGDIRIPVMPTFHPAYVLRNYTVETRQKVWSDMQAVMQRISQVEKS